MWKEKGKGREEKEMSGATLQIQTAPIFEPLLTPHRYKGAYGGRGAAKSWFFAELLIEHLVMDQNKHAVCIREVQSSIAMSVKRVLELKIIALGVESYFEIQESRIKCHHGDGLIIFQGMQNHTNDTIKSLESFDICWVEEAQSLSQRSLDLLRPTIRKEGSELWFSWNPRYVDDPIDVLLRPRDDKGQPTDDLPPDSIVVKSNYYDNPWFPEVLRLEMEFDRRRDPDKYAHVWLGEYEQHSEARVFHNWTVEEFETPPDAFHRLGIDFGYSKDPSTMIRCHVVGKKLYIDQEAYKIGCEIDQLPDLFIENVDECQKWPISADSARPDLISYLKRNGFPKIYGATKGPKSIIQGVIFLQSYDIIIHPRCVHAIDEFSRYSWKIDSQTGLITSVLADKKNHIIDPLRYANERHRILESSQKIVHAESIPIVNRWNNARVS